MDRTELNKAYNFLVSLRLEAEGKYRIHEHMVATYNDNLKTLERLSGLDLKAFHIPDYMLAPRETGSQTYPKPETFYSKEVYCEGEIFRVRLNAVLGYFHSETETPESRPADFRPPDS